MGESKHTRAEVIDLLHRLAVSLSDEAEAVLDEAIALLRVDGAAPLMLEALRRVEWLISVRGVGQCCPDCGGEEIDGHRAGCKLGGAIKAATGGKP